MAEVEYFHWADYLVLAAVLALSAAIGFYYACTGGKQKTTKEYLFADKNMHWLPVSASLLATYISSLSLVSLPAEVISYGTIIIYMMVFTPIGIMIASKFYLPVFEQIRLVSIYKYIEKRFGKPVKVIMAVADIMKLLFIGGLTIYGPALSMSAVTGINIWLCILTVLLVTTMYTVLGGMKAVLWTDTIQLGIILVGVFVVLIAGTIREGGPAEIYRVNELSGRMDAFDASKIFLTDPRMRHTIWNMGVESVFMSISMYGISQMSVMRALALKPTHRNLSYTITAGMAFLVKLLSCIIGLIIFAGFRYCDPLKEGTIFKTDQYYPMYVMKAFGKYPGLPGFILSAIFSGSLSTLSSFLSAIAAIAMEDFIRPWRPKISDKKTTLINKVLAVVAACVSILFSLFVMNFGNSIISTLKLVIGIFGGPSIAVFSMGIFLPFVNKRGAMIGFFSGVAIAAVIGIGGMVTDSYIYKYPVTTEGCNITDPLMLSKISTPVYDPATWNPQSHFRTGITAIFDISYAWVKFIGIVVTTFIAVLASVIFIHFEKEPEKVNYLLISPHVVKSRFLPKSWKDRIDFTEDPSLAKKPVQDEDGNEDDPEKKSQDHTDTPQEMTFMEQKVSDTDVN